MNKSKIYTNQEKTELVDRLKKAIDSLGSQNAYSGYSKISIATISKMVAGKDWDKMTKIWGDLERTLEHFSQQAASDSKEPEVWKTAETRILKRMVNIMRHAQEQSIVKAISDRQGMGKSYSAKHYMSISKNVYYTVAKGNMKKRAFLLALCKALSIIPNYQTDMMLDQIVSKLTGVGNFKPLLIIDEFGDLSAEAMRVFKDLYNELEGKCGFVIIGGLHFKKCILEGVNLTKQSFQEIYSRFGCEFLDLQPKTKIDPVTKTTIATEESIAESIAIICRANGISDRAIIAEINKNSQGDLRKVRNDIEQIFIKKIK